MSTKVASEEEKALVTHTWAKNAVNPVDINNIKDKIAGVFQNIMQGINDTNDKTNGI